MKKTTSHKLGFTLAAVLALTAVLAPCARSTTFTWDGGSATNDNWSSSANWNPNGVPDNDGTATLVFAGDVRLTPNADSAWSLSRIHFDGSGTSAFTLGGSTLSVGTGGIDVSDSATVGLTHQVNNNLILTGDQTWTVEGDYLRVNGNVAIGSHTLSDYSPPGTGGTTIAGIISGTGTVESDRMTLLGANTFSGGLTISSSAYFGDDSAAGTGDITVAGSYSYFGAYYASGARTIANAIHLTGTNARIGPSGADLTLSGIIDGTGDLEVQNWGNTTILSGNNTFSGGLTVATVSGVLAIGHNHAAGTGTLTFSSGAIRANGLARTLSNTLSIDGDFEVSGGFGLNLTFTGNGTLRADHTITVTNTATTKFSGDLGQDAPGHGLTVHTNAGTTILSGDNTFSGGLTVDQDGGTGTLAFGHDNAAGTGTLHLGASKIRADGGTRNLGNNVRAEGDVEIAGSDGFTLSGPITLTNPSPGGGRTFDITNSAAVTFSGAIGQTLGNRTFTKTGSGLLSFSGPDANTYSGRTTVSEGILRLNKTAGVTAIAGDITVGAATGPSATLRLAASHQIANASSVTVNKTGLLDLNGSDDTIGALTLSSGEVTTGAGTLTLGGDVVASGVTTASSISGKLNLGGVIRTFEVTGGFPVHRLEIPAVISNGSLTKTGGGRLTLSGANTYTGNTSIDDGTLRLAASNVIADASDVSVEAGAKFDLDGFDDTIGSLSVRGGAVTSGAGILSLGGTLYSSTADGSTVGGILDLGGGTRIFSVGKTLEVSASIFNGKLRKTGFSTLTLTSGNNYTGGTQIDTGTVSIASDTHLGDPSGALTLDGGTLATTAALTTSRAITLDTGGGTFEVNAGNLVINGSMGGAGTLKKEGSGTLILNVAATYGGSTIVDAGTLRLGFLNRIPDSSSVVVQGGATLDLANFLDVVGALAGSGSVTLGTATLKAGANGLLADFSGEMSGTGGFEKVGPGIQVFSGVNTYTGGTVVTAGTLSVSTDSNLGDVAGSLALNGPGATLRNTATFTSARNVALNAGSGYFNTAGADLTLTGPVGGVGTLNKSGSGRLTLTSSNGYSGGTHLLAGTLAIGDNLALGGGTLYFDGGALAASGAPRSATNAVQITADSSLTGGFPLDLFGNVLLTGSYAMKVSAGTKGVFHGVISEALPGYSFSKDDLGDLTVLGASTYTGGTFIVAGRLVVDNTTGSGTGTGAVTVRAGAILGGSGFISGALIVDPGGIVEPGHSPGALHTGSETWMSGGIYHWEINNANGVPGLDSGWDLLQITGSLTIAASSQEQFVIELAGLTPGNAPGVVAGFDNTLPYEWMIAGVTGNLADPINGFDPAKFSIHAAGFISNNPLAGGTFGVDRTADSIVVKFTPAPEPGTAALLGTALLGLAGGRRQRRVTSGSASPAGRSA